MFAEDDVGRLDVAMDHATGVGVIDGVANVEEAAEKFAKLKGSTAGVVRGALARPSATLSRWQSVVAVELLDRLLQAVALDEPHGVVRPAAAVGAQAVDRHDPGVLEPAGDLGLEHESLAAHRVVGVLLEDLL